MKKFQEDAKALENNLQRIREYVGRVNQLMAELSTGVKVLVERGALDNTEKKINNDFMGYYKAVHNLEKHFGEIAEEIKAYDDKINASQYQRMDSLRIELKALQLISVRSRKRCFRNAWTLCKNSRRSTCKGWRISRNVRKPRPWTAAT